MSSLCAPRLAAAAVLAAVVAAAIAVATAPTAAVAAPWVPPGGRVAKRLAVSTRAGAMVATSSSEEQALVCLPALAPMCDLGAHLELASMEKCLPRGSTEKALAARSAFAHIESMVAAAWPVSTGSCCYAKATIVDIQVSLVALAPAVRCSTGAPLSGAPNKLDLTIGGSATTWGSVIIHGDDRFRCCDAQNYAPDDPAHRPCCVDGCYEMAATLGWMGYTLDSCCAHLNNREQYGRVCPPGTLNQVLVEQ